MNPALSIQGLRKRYSPSSTPALAGVDLDVPAGAWFGLLGPNGAGKTTLISVVCGLLRPDAGAVRFGAAAPRVGLVPQEIALYPSLTGRENLRLFGAMGGLRGAELEVRIDGWLDRLGLAAHADRRVAHYSGGMKRRANLVAALLGSPDLLVLDEPTVGVDPQSRQLMWETLADLRGHGVTILHTTHYLREAEERCGELAVIDNGRIIAQGSPKALLAAHPGCRDLESLFLELTGRELRD